MDENYGLIRTIGGYPANVHDSQVDLAMKAKFVS